MEFAYEAHGNRMKGFIDALCLFQGKYYIFDWKSNYLGPSTEDYTYENIKAAMRNSNYFLQASIYAEALRRYLALIEKKSFSEIFGGAVYLFMRGAKAYTFMPDLSLQDRASVKEVL
jgi:exodeoxyribonuclease V beta subunit